MVDSNSSNDKNPVEDPKELQIRLNTFVQESIEKYKYPELRDDDLWEIFQDDFKGWKLDDFKSISSQYITGLRNQLRCRDQIATDKLLFDPRYNPNRENQNLLPPKDSLQSTSDQHEDIDRGYNDQKDMLLKRHESVERKSKDDSNREFSHPRDQYSRQPRSINQH
ncbi:hypothetical protein GcM3_131020, partial [Golovinomyces cichoracearum]